MTAPRCAEPARAARLRRRAALAGIATALALVVLKSLGALVTGSVGLLATLLDSLADLAASTITLVAIGEAVRPPDREHRFGHGKAEHLSALAQAAFVAGSGVMVVWEAASRLIDPQPLDQPQLGVVVMVLSLALTGALVVYQRHVVRATGSPAIAADQLHYRTDLVAGTAIILGLWLVAWTGQRWIDLAVGLAMALWLLWNAQALGRHAIDALMDREAPRELRERVKAIVRAHPDSQGLHDLRTRQAAGTDFIEFHLELDGAMTLDAAHQVSDAIEQALKAAFPAAEILIHQEPAGIDDERLDHRLWQPDPP